ncbi:nucleotide disphospho-sugar-binding domain-containing protein [Methylocapsa acidiphila]|uniref:nucleotide disphospho-sugar-binding domain-containing protein n=1 Tax=Methylocapsa acidiphila TaxID=133552 RepID=UPI000420171C|nr:glycosyltransferase [Methylocapsa acidiphila]
MSTVAIFILPNPGGLLATLDLANRLRAARHVVHYFGLADSAAEVRARGFRFTIVLEAYFPGGFLREAEALERLSPGLAALRAQRRFIARINAFVDNLLTRGGDAFREELQRVAPDLVIFASTDEWMEWPAFVAWGAGLACVYFQDSLNPRAKSGLPPISSALIPADNRVSRLRISFAWARLQFEERLWSGALSLLRLSIDFDAVRRRLAARYGYPLGECGGDRRAPELPELIAWPRALEFPCREAPGQIYVGASLSLNRSEEPFPWDRLDDDRPIYYCALGSLVWFGEEKYRRFFQTVIDVAQAGPHRQWVLATGEGLDPGALRSPSSNIVIVRRAPQLALLRRARLMITHGGANTVKECAYFGVPMIAFPLGYDHPGNVARMVHRGLGLRGDRSKLTPRYLERLISKIEDSTTISEHIDRVRGLLREEHESAPAVRFIEALLAEKKIADDDEKKTGAFGGSRTSQL